MAKRSRRRGRKVKLSTELIGYLTIAVGGMVLINTGFAVVVASIFFILCALLFIKHGGNISKIRPHQTTRYLGGRVGMMTMFVLGFLYYRVIRPIGRFMVWYVQWLYRKNSTAAVVTTVLVVAGVALWVVTNL